MLQLGKPASSTIKDSAFLISKFIDVLVLSDNLIENHMGNDIIFKKARDIAFRNFLNSNITYGILLAESTDYYFKKEIIGKNDNEMRKFF